MSEDTILTRIHMSNGANIDTQEDGFELVQTINDARNEDFKDLIEVETTTLNFDEEELQNNKLWLDPKLVEYVNPITLNIEEAVKSHKEQKKRGPNPLRVPRG